MRFSTRLYFASRRLLRHARKGAFCGPLPSLSLGHRTDGMYRKQLHVFLLRKKLTEIHHSSFIIHHSSLKKSRRCLLFLLIYSNSFIFAKASAMGTFTLTVLSRVAISITPPSIFLGLTIALTGTPKRSASENIKPAETGLSS